MRWSFLAWPLILLIDIYMLVNFIAWHEESVYEFDQRQSDIIVNYAIEAATQEMLTNTGDIALDYIDWESIQLDPQAGYNAYMAIVLRSQNWADTEYNRKEFEAEHIPFFLVAGYDGYYLLSKQESNYTYSIGRNGTTDYEYTHKGWDMIWTPKIPYATTDSETYGSLASTVNGSNSTFKSFYLGDDYYLRFDYESDTQFNTDYKANIMVELAVNNESKYSDIISKKKLLISDILTTACNEALFRGTFGKANGTFYIPPYYAEWFNTNSIEKPSIITYLSNSNMHDYQTYSFAVGGANITEADYVLCYEQGGTKYYTSVKNRNSVELLPNVNKNKFRILPSSKDAALEGFWYDMRFF